jgi:glutathione S-transferase
VQAGKYVEPVRQKLDGRFAWIDRQLDGNAYLTGDTFTIADAYLFAVTGWGKADWMRSVYNADIDLSRHANLRAWYERVRARPAVQQVLAADGLAS